MEKELEILKQIPTAWGDHIHFAEWIVKRIYPETIVDLGVHNGYSTLCFAKSKIGHVYGIDSFEGDEYLGDLDSEKTYEYVMEKLNELHYDNVTIIKGYFDDVAKNWDKQIDILHIDGFHKYESVKNDYDTWSKFVKETGIILFHDTEVEHFGVRKFFDEINLPKTNFTFCYGLGVVSQDQNIINEIKDKFEITLK